MRVLVTGAGGMLGTDLCADLAARGHEVIAADVREAENIVPLDITHTQDTLRAVGEMRPEAILHCAAWTDVDGAERTPDPAYRVNALGAWNVAAAARAVDALMVYISTDFVFDGSKSTPYTEFDAVNPLGHYGASKEAGERLVRQTTPNHIIARTAWLYGVHGKNFPYTILRLARERPEIPVVADQIGCPTHTRDLSRKLCELIEDPLPGTYHICNAGECSWFEFARAIVAGAGRDTKVVPITAEEYAQRFSSPTRRPAYSPMRRFALELRGMDDLPPWQDALADFLALVPEDRR
jgi:dTDP-4-dehydrorhamnose reductase